MKKTIEGIQNLNKYKRINMTDMPEIRLTTVVSNEVINSLALDGITDTLYIMIPILLVLTLLTFVAYSLLAGILASMTTNLEDFQQLQTPIVLVSLIGYYLSMMAGVFKGSLSA